MNIFVEYQQKILKSLNGLQKAKKIKLPLKFKNITVEISPKNQKADISCNAAMVLSKYNNTNPVKLAEIIKKNLLITFEEFKKIEISGPGFINISFQTTFWKNYLSKVISLNSKFGSNRIKNKKYNVEFVSANPTGPLHVGHCRGAILGDVLSNLLSFNGNKVTKEYYVNDHGGQIKIFVMSVYYRIIEILEKKQFPTDKDLYPGDYIINIAQKIVNNNAIKNFSNFEKIYNKLEKESLKYSMELIINNLNLLGIKHNNFVYESKLIHNKTVLKTVNKLKKKNYIYEGKLSEPKGELTKEWKIRKQLLFKSTKFGDDLDRPLQKADGSWTYFAADMAYHSYKISRNYDDVLINILGADHSGYIKRITSATKAISNNKTDLICKVSQLVKLFKKGEPFKMSKRKGDYITVQDLMDEVGKDSVRFMMLNRSNDVELDFDFEKVTEKSKDNPVFYVQYAYARINSIFRILNINLKKKIKVDKNFTLNEHEIEILKKISEWPKCVELSSTKLEPHRIPFYLYELVTLFHSYWNMGRENKNYRFIQDNNSFNNPSIILLQSLAIVIENGMNILGVSTPKSM